MTPAPPAGISGHIWAEFGPIAAKLPWKGGWVLHRVPMAKAPQVSRFKSNPLDWTLGVAPPMGGSSRSAAPMGRQAPQTPPNPAGMI